MIVVLTVEADLERIGDYIARHDPRRAISFVAELIECCRRLIDAPLGFPLVPRYERIGVRRRVHGACLIFYRITGGTIEVLHILHGARDYDILLFPMCDDGFLPSSRRDEKLSASPEGPARDWASPTRLLWRLSQHVRPSIDRGSAGWRCEAAAEDRRGARDGPRNWATMALRKSVTRVHDDEMTDLLERAMAAARTLPPDMQDDIARMVLRYAGEDQPIIQLTPDEEESFAESRSQASRREFASDEKVRAVWAKHGL